jgi:hypothetical protein
MTKMPNHEYEESVHIHNFNIPSTINDEHRHQVRGRTAPAFGGLDCHIHYYEGTTTLNDGHVHYFRGYTGPAVANPGGGHRHKMEGQTSFNDQHLHYYNGFTGEGINYRLETETNDLQT